MMNIFGKFFERLINRAKSSEIQKTEQTPSLEIQKSQVNNSVSISNSSMSCEELKEYSASKSSDSMFRPEEYYRVHDIKNDKINAKKQMDNENVLNDPQGSNSDQMEFLTLKSFDFASKQFILKLRLIDLVEDIEAIENDLLDELMYIPISKMNLSDMLLWHLRQSNIFPDDGFDCLACCTLSYLSKLAPEDEWMDILLRNWRSAIEELHFENRCYDITQLASKSPFTLSFFSIPNGLSHLPLSILNLKKHTLEFFESLKIKTFFDLGRFSEADLLMRTEHIGPALKSLSDLYTTATDFQKEDWNILLDFLNKPLDQFITCYLHPSNISQRDINIFLIHKGFIGKEKSTLEYIGDRYGISRERTRQIITHVGETLKQLKKARRQKLAILPRFLKTMISSIGGITPVENFTEIIKCKERFHPDSLLAFSELLLDNDSSIVIENSILTIWPRDRINLMLDLVKRCLEECGEPMSAEDILNAKTIFEFMEKSNINVSAPILKELTHWTEYLGILFDGRIGLKEWKWAFPNNKKERLYYLLRISGHPMHYSDAHNELCRIFPNLYSKDDPRIALSTFQTYKEVFELVDQGTYALKEWSLNNTYITVGNAIEQALENAGGILTYPEIRKAVWEIRDCPEINLKVALGQKRFTQVGSERWNLTRRLVSNEDQARDARLRQILSIVPSVKGSKNGRMHEQKKPEGINGFDFVNKLKNNRNQE